jgi:hypothetical protein
MVINMLKLGKLDEDVLLMVIFISALSDDLQERWDGTLFRHPSLLRF